ncbi:MAG: hypothetical protein IMZ61_03395 [Planctomycetes bacterium]|nr:hypothetical protein [Planctomycetota bacterium]
MNASSLPSKTISTGYRFADWAVITVTVVALLAGWLTKNSVESRSVPFEGSGISAQTPQGWLMTSAKGNEILHVTDPLSSGFGTTYSIENIPVASGATVDQAVSLLTLQRGQALTAYRILEQRQVTVFGQAAYEVGYVFVESNPDLTHNDIPNIVRGLDYIFLNGDHVIVATYWADENAFESDLGRFQRFLSTLKF